MSFDFGDIVITAKDIILQPFLTGDEESANQAHHDPQATSAFNAYLSTPKFVTTLTDLSLELIHQTDQQEFLQAELKKINRRLPAAVYMPFVNDSIRNYAILHIVADEAKIFVTKERAPVLLHFEAFRPEELMLLSAKPERPIK